MSIAPKFINLKLGESPEVLLPLKKNESSGSLYKWARKENKRPPTDQKYVWEHQWKHAPAGYGLGLPECLIKSKELKWINKKTQQKQTTPAHPPILSLPLFTSFSQYCPSLSPKSLEARACLVLGQA